MSRPLIGPCVIPLWYHAHPPHRESRSLRAAGQVKAGAKAHAKVEVKSSLLQESRASGGRHVSGQGADKRSSSITCTKCIHATSAYKAGCTTDASAARMCGGVAAATGISGTFMSRSITDDSCLVTGEGDFALQHLIGH